MSDKVSDERLTKMVGIPLWIDSWEAQALARELLARRAQDKASDAAREALCYITGRAFRRGAPAELDDFARRRIDDWRALDDALKLKAGAADGSATRKDAGALASASGPAGSSSAPAPFPVAASADTAGGALTPEQRADAIMPEAHDDSRWDAGAKRELSWGAYRYEIANAIRDAELCEREAACRAQIKAVAQVRAESAAAIARLERERDEARTNARQCRGLVRLHEEAREAAIRQAAAVSPERIRAGEETAWLIEHQSAPVWIAEKCGMATWGDANSAIRFSRERDARAAADIMLPGALVKILEHGWADPPRALDAAESGKASEPQKTSPLPVALTREQRDRDELWCRVLVATLDVQQVNDVLVCFLRARGMPEGA